MVCNPVSRKQVFDVLGILAINFGQILIAFFKIFFRKIDVFGFNDFIQNQFSEHIPARGVRDLFFVLVEGETLVGEQLFKRDAVRFRALFFLPDDAFFSLFNQDFGISTLALFTDLIQQIRFEFDSLATFFSVQSFLNIFFTLQPYLHFQCSNLLQNHH